MTEELFEDLEQNEPRAVYVGGGKFINGIPARDLTADEWASFSSEERDYFVKLGIYEVIYD